MFKSKRINEWISVLVIAIILSIIIRTFICEIYIVVGDSMLPTLHNANKMLINKLPKRVVDYNHADIIVVSYSGEFEKDIVKRVIALAGDTIEIVKGKVIVNDKIISEEYLGQVTEGNYSKVTIPEGKIFVMGDNRNQSLDSRYDQIGFIDVKNVKGRAMFILWPINEWKFFKSER